MTHTNDDEAMARLAALSAKLRSQDPIPSLTPDGLIDLIGEGGEGSERQRQPVFRQREKRSDGGQS